MGYAAGYFRGGNRNVFLGNAAGYLVAGNENTLIGYHSGKALISGSGNVFVGKGAGGNITNQSNRLYISNSETNTPLVYGEFDTKKLQFNGKVGIGNNIASFPPAITGLTLTNYNLFVKGGILTEEVRVRTGWADYVFKDDYKLKSLQEVESFIKENGHLENIPSEKEVNEQGIELGNIVKLQQEKIEELTLYLIQQNKEMAEMKARLQKLENK